MIIKIPKYVIKFVVPQCLLVDDLIACIGNSLSASLQERWRFIEIRCARGLLETIFGQSRRSGDVRLP